MLQLLKSVSLEPVLSNKRSHHNEKPTQKPIDKKKNPIDTLIKEINHKETHQLNFL